jgi:hypothetical protein
LVGHLEPRLLLDQLRDLHHFREAPALRLREGRVSTDAHDVADVRLVLLVVGVELVRAADHLLYR